MVVPIPRWLVACVVALAWLASPAPALAQSALETFRAEIDLAKVFPGADRLAPVEGAPPSAAAMAGERRLGYVLVNSDVVNSVGYSGKPIHVAVGVALDGEIVGGQLLKHSEPIVLIGIPEARIATFIDGYRGYNVLTAAIRGRPPVDIVSGATVTVIVIGDTMIRAAAKVLRSRAGPAAATPTEPAREVDRSRAGTRSWAELLGDGSVRRLHLTLDEVNAAFAKLDPRAAERPERGEPTGTFIDLYVAPAGVPEIGRSLLGEQAYQRLGDRQAILVMAQGRYSFRGSGFVRGGLFDRIELIQGEETIRFRDRDYQRLGGLAAAGAPSFPEIGLFTLPEGVSFAPAEPWRLQLLVSRAVGALEKVFLTWDVGYQLPDIHLAAAPAPTPPSTGEPVETGEEPLWKRIWDDRLLDVAIVGAGLAVLTAIFFFQDFLAARPRLTWWTRTAFLTWTLLWLGWWANAQLSVVNVLTFTNALITDFRWDYFLMDPLVFILWAAVATSLLFWGRGAFCGWLCPFGALQEFANRFARLIRVPQISVPWGLHERLWPIKYIVFLGLFGLSLYSLTLSERAAEVEPFKTAIILNFVRDWPFVVYAATLVAASMVIDRFFCRYLCPLGAALAIPARIRMFEWLKRHRECGAPCQRCAIECPVQAIHPDGRINPNECIYCLHCQALYWDEHRCPAMIQRRLRRERAQAMSAPPKTRPEPTQPGGA
ncbi:MAG: regulatory protein NosR [Alphaproteobacteria bacterium]|nr:regulatory protein NosR [Alphaproteobacteria bacterium]